jgi:hypothetical protein
VVTQKNPKNQRVNAYLKEYFQLNNIRHRGVLEFRNMENDRTMIAAHDMGIDPCIKQRGA